MKKPTVLIVDDCQADLEGIKKYVNWQKFGIGIGDVYLASNGQEGYDKAMLLKPDVIITDVDMPVKNGLKLVEELTPHLTDTHYIFMSCFDEYDYVKGAINLEACGFLKKPINIDEVEQLLLKVFSNIESVEKQKTLIESLRYQVNANMGTFRRQFFFELLNYNNTDNFEEKLAFLKLDESMSYYFCFVNIDTPDDSTVADSTEKTFILRNLLMNRIKDELLSENDNVFIVTDKMIAFLKLLPEEENNIDLIIKKIYDFKDAISSDIGTTITVACSTVFSGIKDIYKNYQSSLVNSKAFFFSDNDKTILLEKEVDTTDYYDYNLNTLKTELYEIINDTSPAAAESFINKYYDDIPFINENYVKSVSFSMLSILLAILTEKNLSFEDVYDNKINVWQKLIELDTVVSIKEFMLKILLSIFHFLKDNNSKTKYAKISTDIVNIIDKEYATVNSVKDITYRLYISPNYANTIFKAIMGISISHYLTTKRISVAKELLNDPYTKIGEVSEKVGYASPGYFRMVFKEYEGITPREYVSSISKGSIIEDKNG